MDLNVDEMSGYRSYAQIERLDPATVDTITMGWALE